MTEARIVGYFKIKWQKTGILKRGVKLGPVFEFVTKYGFKLQVKKILETNIFNVSCVRTQ